MISSISRAPSTPAPGTGSGAQAPAPEVRAPEVQAPASVPVSVDISPQAQVKQLDSSGSSLQEIVLKTGIDLATVKQYLGL